MAVAVAGACLCNAVSNTLWKLSLGSHPFKYVGLTSLAALLVRPLILVGIFLYVVSMFVYFYLLSNYKLSVIVPLTSLTYVLNTISAYLIFREEVSLVQILGIVLLCAGIVLVFQIGVRE